MTEARSILLRRSSPAEPIELVIVDDRLGCLTYQLRLGQLHQIALDAVRFALKADGEGAA